MNTHIKKQNIIIIKQIKRELKPNQIINTIKCETNPDGSPNRVIVTTTTATAGSARQQAISPVAAAAAISPGTSKRPPQQLIEIRTSPIKTTATATTTTTGATTKLPHIAIVGGGVGGIGGATSDSATSPPPSTVIRALSILTPSPNITASDTAISPVLSTQSSCTSDAETSTDMLANISDFSDNQSDDKLLNGREARNRAEKNRRDKLNGSIQELSAMVPHVAESPRRVDKTAILRFSAHGLRVHYVFGQSIKEPPERKPQLTEALMKLLDSFHITITCHGQIVLISATVEQHLGHCQTDLYGQNILNITHPDDQAMLRRQLIPTDLENLFDVQPEDENGEPRPRTSEEEEMIDRQLKADTRSFTIRLARAGPRTEPTTYEVVRIDGCFRRADAAPRGVKCSNFPSGLQLIRRARGRDDNIPLHSISGNDIVLVGMVRLIRPPKLNTRIMEANSFEYQTRHLIDGRIIDCDQRIGLVAGYMKGEVTGLSPFTFMHQDDVRWVIVALRQMYDCKSDYGESCYRLLTRNNRFIYLQTKGFLEIDKETNKVHSFVCINTLVSDEEGRRRVQEMKNKFSLIINTKIPLSSSLDIPASENPQQLEKAVLCLIQNLQKNGDDDENDASTSNTHHHDSHKDSSQIASGMSPAAVRAASSCSIRSTKTPPLALIPPEAETVKSSISKSVDVVAKNIRSARSMQSPQSCGAASPMSPVVNRDETSSDSTSTNGSGVQNRPSVLQRISSVKHDEPPSTTVKVKEECFHSPQSRVPPLPNSTCNCFYETGGPRNDCISCQEFALITSPPPTAEVPLPRQFRSPSSSSVLKRTHSESSSDGRLSPLADAEDQNQRTTESPKRRLIYNETAGKEIRQVISNSFQQINRSLNHIESATTELRGQCNNFTLPNTDLKLNEIFEEHQRQQKMLVSIKSEFEANLQSTPFIDSPVIVDQSLALTRPVEESFSPKNDLKPR
ncbi:neuronal PAS domain-containing protein 2-like isoform X2 [Eupeodes corollae]|uniref:neuronal PAS domain-containing protein 2-like isoform X2 n=1 Tax=Eupeodes corollae TaxID=290404 RepID=UPI0024923AB0|nr:neuronal PAS domain-containing protein 2-like isoform X2 [Eupeodes corollae]XP_055914383.1 neuronal PAS domain-containing protein 2-like isoform X2 [Eupeodes corollae]XP_055914384.1 neuronal PAS domain-containing protein 2-like isoform X2 [Eupeodes corollae]XP_055914385.1 neuronal PAS domain-containing protein 2-like isoform X2 [Eupeodes corollae]